MRGIRMFGLPAWIVLVIFVVGFLVILSWVLNLVVKMLPAILLIVVLIMLFRYLNKKK